MKKKDYENIQEEIGDLLWDFFAFSLILEEEGKISSKEVMLGMLQKMKERKPHIFEKRIPSKEEEWNRFYEVKARQKAQKNQKL